MGDKITNITVCKRDDYLNTSFNVANRKDLTFNKSLFVPTLLGNSKGPVELGNSNICVEVKLCFYLCRLKNSLP